MTPIKTLEFDNFSIEAHIRFAEDQSFTATANLPKHPSIGVSISGSFHPSFSSNLENIPFFDTKTLSWSGFSKAPKTSTSLPYFFSRTFFFDLQSAANKFENFLKKETPTPSKAISTLISFFKEIKTLDATSALIDAQVKRFHKG